MIKIFLLLKSILYSAVIGFRHIFSDSRDSHYVVASNYGGEPDPNAICIANYLRSMGERVFVVGDWGRELELDCLSRGSWLATQKTLSSKACFYTHSFSDAIPFAHRLFRVPRFMNMPKLVFMQHGVTGLKRELSNGVKLSSYIASLEHTFDSMLVCSASEKRLLIDMGIPSKKLAITGFPRFDRYRTHSDLILEKILVFLTWQDINSWEEKVSQLQSSVQLQKLQDRGYIVECMPHSMQKKISLSNWDRPQDLQMSILTSEFLITDDSSLAWDFFYGGRQVCFFRASDEWLCAKHYLDDWRCDTVGDFDEWLIRLVSNRLPKPPKFARHYDTENSKRAYQLINEY